MGSIKKTFKKYKNNTIGGLFHDLYGHKHIQTY